MFVDCWTTRGGSQFINSASTGRYLDYLCDEVVPFIDGRYPTLSGARSPRAGRQVVGRLRRDGRADAPARRVRRARLARRRRAVRVLLPARVPATWPAALRDNFEGSYEVFFERLAAADHFDFAKFGDAFEMYGYASRVLA